MKSKVFAAETGCSVFAKTMLLMNRRKNISDLEVLDASSFRSDPSELVLLLHLLDLVFLVVLGR